MKILLESPVPLKGRIEENVNESNSEVKKTYIIEGIFSTPDKRNRNGRIYPRSLWESNVLNYQNELISNSINTYGEWEHPPRSDVHREKAVIKMLELKMTTEGVWGRAVVVDNDRNPNVLMLKEKIRRGEKIGVSSRGVGTVSESGVVEEFYLITYDAVDSPSDYNAMLNGIYEGFNVSNGIVTEKDITIENGCIGEECLIDVDNSNFSKTNENLNENTENKKSYLDMMIEIKKLKKSLVNESKEREKLTDLMSQYLSEVLNEMDKKIDRLIKSVEVLESIGLNLNTSDNSNAEDKDEDLSEEEIRIRDTEEMKKLLKLLSNNSITSSRGI